jgi:hypothetical protein
MLSPRARLVALLGVAALALLGGCGKRGDPLPPLSKAPQVVTSLRVAQRGSDLEVSFETPRLTTAGAGLPAVELELLHARGEGDFEKIASRSRRKAAPGERLTERSPLPPAGTLVRVAVRAWHAGERSAPGPVASLKVQPTTPVPEGLVASLEKQGVVLRWSPPPPPEPTPQPTPSPSPSPSPSASSSPSPAAGIAPATPAPVAASPPPPPGSSIYRREAKGEYGAPLSKEPVAGPTFRDETAAAGKTWCYVVRTVASREPLVESAPSVEACVDVKDVFPPEPPAGLSALATANGVELSFSPSPDNDLERYRVFRAPTGGPFVQVGELPASERMFTDKDVVGGQSYVYQITALDRVGNESPPSKPAECRVP